MDHTFGPHWPAQVIPLLHHPEDTKQAQRLFHGRGHAYKGMEHITIDWLPPVALITLYAPESLAEIESLACHLMKLSPLCTSVQLQHRYLQSGPMDIIKGKTITQFIIQEDELNYRLSLGKARNTGLFLDMKQGRQWVQAHSLNRRVLNLFAYTCAFSVAALAGGAKSVVNVDMSSPALNVGRENHRLNQHPLGPLRFEKLDIFKSFGRLAKRGPFDLLICDPPTFQKDSVDIAKDYPKILRRLPQFMAPGATIMLCLNAPNLDRNFLVHHMAELAPEYVLNTELKTPAVFVEAENKGLKILIFTAITSTKESGRISI